MRTDKWPPKSRKVILVFGGFFSFVGVEKLEEKNKINRNLIAGLGTYPPVTAIEEDAKFTAQATQNGPLFYETQVF